ncbi:MAG: redox-active disulfide protein 2 [uncultured bacterium]|nr:MAG: redox-active disulfide protein 2 [uncultured bacterium]HBH19202.1 redox-active disulfide protein 2 [Cyanobacteria bacterium UBA9579]
MDIKILGSGCTNCKKLMENTQKAVQELNIEANIEKIDDFKEIMQYGVMMTPALVINGEVKSTGKVLKPEEIKRMLEK